MSLKNEVFLFYFFAKEMESYIFKLVSQKNSKNKKGLEKNSKFEKIKRGEISSSI